MNGAVKSIAGGMVVAALMIGTAFGMRYLKARGLFAGDVHEFVSRSTGVIMGIYVAFLANSLPKTLIPLARLREPAFAQSLRRFIAATLVIGSLLFAVMWLFAPIGLALPLSLASLGSTFALVVAAILTCGISQARGRDSFR
jgi:hypothetical protein